MEIDRKKYLTMNVDSTFKKRVDKFIKDFEEEKGVKLSYTQATKIIDTKIEKIGGLKV